MGNANKQQMKVPDGTYMLLDKNELELDYSYQRDADLKEKSQRLIKKIAENWNWVLCGALTVAFRDEGFRIVDGGHRWKGSLLVPEIKDLPCIVFDATSPSHEAEVFVALNTLRRNLTAYDKYRGELRANDRVALKVHHLVNDIGYKVVDSERSKHSHTISCVALLKKQAKQDSKMLETILGLCQQLYQGGHIQAVMLRGLWRLMKVHKLPLTERIHRERLISLGADVLMSSIMRTKLAFAGTKNRDLEARAILAALNHGRPKKYRLTIDGDI